MIHTKLKRSCSVEKVMINILFAGNDKIFDGILTCMLSILIRTKTREPFTFYIFTMDVSHIKEEYKALSIKDVDFLDKVAKEYNVKNRVIRKDVIELYNKEFAHCPNEMTYCSPYTLLRLLADKIDAIPDKLLYLDVDIMFQRDIKLLYHTNIDKYEYAAARDHYGKYLIHPNYINAGVLLLNMKMIKKTQLFEKARKLLKIKKLIFADQSAIYRNTIKKKMLPQKFNDQKFLHKHTVVRHFSKRLFYLPYPHTDNVKQWQVDRVHKIFGYHQFDDIYEVYYHKKQEHKTYEQ
mgnify:CR=1 FL=1